MAPVSGDGRVRPGHDKRASVSSQACWYYTKTTWVPLCPIPGWAAIWSPLIGSAALGHATPGHTPEPPAFCRRRDAQRGFRKSEAPRQPWPYPARLSDKLRIAGHRDDETNFEEQVVRLHPQ